MQNTDEVFRLSAQQHRLWPFQKDNPVYRSQCAVLIKGELNVDLLYDALLTIINRHEILRTYFHRPLGLKAPFQVVRKEALLKWEVINLAGWPENQQMEEVNGIFERISRQPDHLAGEPTLTAILMVLSVDNHVLLLSLPSLCADQQSLRNLVKEISHFYDAPVERGDEAVDALQYVDYTESQSESLQSESGQTGKEYWRRLELESDFTEVIPFERKRDKRALFTPGAQLLSVDSDLFIKAKSLAAGYGLSDSTVFLACWLTLLTRLTQLSTVIIGYVFNGRDDRETDEALGLFTRWLPLRFRYEDDVCFNSVLTQLEKAVTEARQWQEYFQGEVGASDDGDGAAPFSLGFEFNECQAKYDVGCLGLSVTKSSCYTEPFKLKLGCLIENGSPVITLHYDAALIGAEAIKCLARQFEALLTDAVARPESPLSQLQIIAPAERHLLLAELNNTGREDPGQKCIQELFEEQVSNRPDATAVVFEDQQLSFFELNRRANQLAHYLKGLGLGPESKVPLFVDRSLDMFVGLLGILKAGAAYVPMDPGYPEERLAFMLAEIGGAVVVTQKHLTARLPAGNRRLVCLDADWDQIARESSDNPVSKPLPENLAYVIFTSGSTGRVKGVAVEHRQLINYILAIIERLALPTGSSYATVTTLAADLGNTMIFPAFCGGGCLHVISQERITDPNALANYFRQHQIDCLKIVPSHLEALLSSPEPAGLLPRRRLVLGGETSSWEMARKLKALAPECIVYNHYGPTETTVGVITYCLSEGLDDEETNFVPLGQPIANAEAYILDEGLQLAPIGGQGELYIGGAGLSRGYLNEPGLTAEKFIPNPFSAKLGARLYKSGDLARYLPDGKIEFRGRADNQVKFHGHRIELNEIRCALNKHPQINDSVIVAAKRDDRIDALVAYYVAQQEIDVTQLRQFLQKSLVEETIPKIYVHLNKLPLTLNGKIDYASLPSLDAIRRSEQRVYVAPRTPAEKIVADIYAQILGIERVGLHDNFFELGGHSLPAIRVISELRAAFRVELPLRTLFDKPTPAELALELTRLQLKQENDEEVLQLVAELEQMSGERIRQAIREESFLS